jgi:O-antigen/teichoic acid export membrane protein
MTLRLGRETLLHFISQVGVTIAGFVASFVIARIGGADVLGLYSVAVAITFWLNVPSTAIADAMTKRISEGENEPVFLGTGITIQAVIAVTFGGTVALVGPFLGQYITVPVGIPLALLVAVNVALIATVAALRGEKRVALSGGLKTIERIIRALLHVALILLGYRVSALIAGHVAAALIAAVVGIALMNSDIGLPSVEAAKSLLEYARFSWLSTLKTRAFGWMDTIVLSVFAINAGVIGVYEVAWNIASVFALVAISVKSTLFPELSEIATEKEYDRVHHLLTEGVVFTGVFLIPGLFGAAVIGERVLRIYGSEFTQGATVLVVLILARALTAYGDQFLGVANAIDRPDVAFRVNVVFVGSNLILNVILVWLYGWWGAAVATAISGGVVFVLGFWALSRIIGSPDVPWLELAIQMSAAVSMTFVVAGLQRLLPRNHYATIFLVGVGVVVYGIVLVGLSTRVRDKAVALLPADVSARLRQRS